MPIPTISGLPPYPEFQDVVEKINKLVNELRNLMLNLDTLNVVSLNAKVIEAGTITADKISVSQLSAISANIGKVTAGQIYGNQIATSESSYPRAELSVSDTLFRASQSVARYVAVSPSNAGNPAIVIHDDVIHRTMLMYIDNTFDNVLGTIGNLLITVNGVAEISATNVIINGVDFTTKADKSAVSKTVYVSATSGGVANIPMTITSGVITS